MALATVLATALWLAPAGQAASLRNSLGRNDVRVWAAPYQPPLGSTVAGVGLPARLEREGYRRVRRRPEHPGEYFWGHDTFWVYRRGSKVLPQALVGWQLARPDGRIEAYRVAPDAAPSTAARDAIGLAPVLLATSFAERRALADWVPLTDLPAATWQALLAIEDARFFQHRGVDGRAVARALLANVKSGGVVQGGSTITQQLVKLRDLSPKRSLGRKASEALRALALEAEHTKEEILEAYLNSVYYGHVDGLALYGIEAAARGYYSRSARALDFRQAVALAALVQAPNRMSPLRNAEVLEGRYLQVLARLELGDEADAATIARARRQGLPPTQPGDPRTPTAPAYMSWLAETLPRSRAGAGVEVSSTLDAHLQIEAENAVREGLGRVRSLRRRSGLTSENLSAALVALDAESGEVVAYVGGDPDRRDDFDRARARRQPGSTVKPFVVLEALDSCGSRSPLFPSRRVRDRPLTLELPSGSWSPQNADRRFRGTVNVQQALVESLNVPLVRIARHCGFEAIANRLRRAGLTLPDEVQPAFVLGAVETSPLELASAYALFVNGGRIQRPRAVRTVRKPSGRPRLLGGRGSRRAASAAASYMVFDLLRRGDLGPGAFGKTGTSSAQRDAWYAGAVGRLVVAVWVGLDDDRSLGAGGARAAEPIWTAFMEHAEALGTFTPRRPARLQEHWIDPDTGLRLKRQRSEAELFLFKGRSRPPLRRLWRQRSPLEPLD